VIALTVAQIADIVGGRLADIDPAEAASTPVTGPVEFDSRAIVPGGLFLALPGANSDGHDMVAPSGEGAEPCTSTRADAGAPGDGRTAGSSAHDALLPAGVRT
jgi:UDP-N-acetylmuramoyl-tripeptide--D-alanyl-D-alanine ligase